MTINVRTLIAVWAIITATPGIFAQTRQQLAFWDFGSTAGYTLDPSFSATMTPPSLTPGGGVLSASGATGVAYTDRRSVAHVAGLAVSWTDVKVTGPNAVWTVAVDTRNWKTLSAQFHSKGNPTTPVASVRIEYSPDGGSTWITHIDSANLKTAANNDSTYVLYTVPTATPFPADCDNNYSVVFKFSNLDAGTGNNAFSFDNFEVSGIRMPPTGVKATPTSTPSIVVTWDPVWNATGYLVKRSTSLAGSYSTVGTITSGTTTSFDNTASVSSNVRYYYKVAATFDSVSTRVSEDSTAVSGLTPTVRPGQPTATVGNQPQVALTWAASAGASYYVVARGTATGVGYSSAIGYASTTSFTDTTVNDDTQYYYAVYSVNTDGIKSPLSLERAVKTRLGPPISLTVQRITPTSVQISCPLVPGATSYKVYRSSSPVGPWGTAIATKTPPTTPPLVHTDPVATDSYYVVTAIVSSQESRFSVSATPCSVLAAPSGVFVSPDKTPRASLSWTPVTTATSYKIWRATTSGGAFSAIGTSTAANYVDTTVTDGGTFFYLVTALKSGTCDSGASPQVGVVIPPAPPATLTATVVGGKVNLSWAASSASVGYLVKRATVNTGPFVTVASVGNTSFTDDPGGGNYFYVVTSLSGGQLESRSSPVASATISFLVLNELKANPPGKYQSNATAANPSRPDSLWEYIELKGLPGYNMAGHRVVVINGADGVGVGRGRTMLVVPLTGTVPASGIVIIKQSGHGGLTSSGLEVVVAPGQRVPQGSDNPDDDLIINEASTIILARGGTAPTVNTDYDSSNDGNLDVDTWGALGQTVIDSIGWFRDPASGRVDRIYAGAPRIQQSNGQPDGATRFPGNTSLNSAAAWYAGSIEENTGGSQSLGYSTDATKRSANFPAGPANSIFLTPGTPNEPNNSSPIGIIGPQSFVGWVYYFGQQNSPITFPLNGVTSLSWDVSDMDVLGNDTDNLLNFTPQVNGNFGTFAMSPFRPCFNIMATFVPDGDWARARSFPFAGVIGGANSIFHGGGSDGSAAVPISGSLMILGDDESNPIGIYDRTTNGVMLNSIDPSPFLALSPPPAGPEVDIEAAATVTEGNTQVTYWIGGHANGPEDDGFAARPNRDRFFATTLTADTGDPTTTQISFGDTVNNRRGFNASFRTAFQTWHPEFRLGDSMAPGIDSKTDYGFNIEGLGLSLDQSTLYIGFRAPLVPAPVGGAISDPAARNLALIAPLTGFRQLIAGGLGVENPVQPVFGNPLQLDLGGKGIRAIRRGSVSGVQWIVAGLPTASRAPGAFALYLWFEGTNAVLEYMVDLAGKSPEAIVEDFGTGIGGASGQVGNWIRLIEDCGTIDWYATGNRAKDFPIDSWGRYRRTRSDVIKIGPWVNTPYIFNLLPNSITATGGSEGFALADTEFWDSNQWAVGGSSDASAGSANNVAMSTPNGRLPLASTALQSLSANPDDAVLGMYGTGSAAGFSRDVLGNRRAVMWDVNSGAIVQVIPTLGGNWNEAHGINVNHNVPFWGLHVVGASQKAGGVGAFLWNEYNSTYVWDLPGVAGSTYTLANAINSYAQVVGASGSSPANLVACLWETRDSWGLQHPTPSPIILGTFPNGGSSEALSINDNGTIVGYAYTNGVKHACLWARESSYYQIYDLGTRVVAANSEARCIAVSGQIVGWETIGGINHGVTWINGRWFDLNSRMPTTGTIISANAVNGLGHITGAWMATPQAVPQAYLLISDNSD